MTQTSVVGNIAHYEGLGDCANDDLLQKVWMRKIHGISCVCKIDYPQDVDSQNMLFSANKYAKSMM